jgi:hypothetical protein
VFDAYVDVHGVHAISSLIDVNENGSAAADPFLFNGNAPQYQ